MKSKPENTKLQVQESEADEWDLSQGMGIFPHNIPLTQNIGCVGDKSKKENNPPKEHGN